MTFTTKLVSYHTQCRWLFFSFFIAKLPTQHVEPLRDIYSSHSILDWLGHITWFGPYWFGLSFIKFSFDLCYCLNSRRFCLGALGTWSRIRNTLAKLTTSSIDGVKDWSNLTTARPMPLMVWSRVGPPERSLNGFGRELNRLAEPSKGFDRRLPKAP